MKRFKKVIVSTVVVVGLLLGGVVTSSVATGDGTVTACANDVDGTLKLPAGSNCPSGYSPVNLLSDQWQPNLTGLVSQDDLDVALTNNVYEIYSRSRTFTVAAAIDDGVTPPWRASTGVVNCQEPWDGSNVAIGGGYSWSNGASINGKFEVTESQPSLSPSMTGDPFVGTGIYGSPVPNSRGWKVRFVNKDTIEYQVNVHVVCAKVRL